VCSEFIFINYSLTNSIYNKSLLYLFSLLYPPLPVFNFNLVHSGIAVRELLAGVDLRVGVQGQERLDPI
jgi:hypothetical protein